MQSLTRKRQLRSNRPLWAVTPHISVPALNCIPDVSIDVLIVGAGIGGALMANAMLGSGLGIFVIDRRRPVHGSSMASTAMIQHEIDVPLHRLVAIKGIEPAQRVWQRSAKAVEGLDALVRLQGLECQFARKRSLYLAGESYGSRALKAECAARSDAGIAVELWTQAELKVKFGIERSAALVSDISASANPAQLTAGLLRRARANGVEIVEGVEITDIVSLDEANVVATSKGQLVRARHVVFCTGYEFLAAVANTSHNTVSTWAMATRTRHPLPNWLKDFLVWEASQPYLYFRATPDGRIVAGGEDEEDETAFNDPGKLESKASRIRKKLEELLGQSIEEPAYRWGAAFGVTSDGLPMIGAVPGLKNVYAAMGYGGNGITFSQIAAEMISCAILGHKDPDASLFQFR